MEDAAPPPRRADRLSWAVFLVLAVIYRWGRCPSFGGGISPGVVYSALYDPGNDPLVLLARLFSHLPFDTPAGNVNALSGVLHAAAAALLFDLLRRLGIKRVPALTSVVLLAFCRRYWYYALIAGYTPAFVCGLAMMFWGVVAWKDEGRAWPLAVSALGVPLFLTAPWLLIHSSPFEVGLISFFRETVVLWLVALAGGLAAQRLELASRKAAAALLAAALVVPVLRPYDLRRHNPMLEWALTATAPMKPGDVLRIRDAGLAFAAHYACEYRGFDCDIRPQLHLRWEGLHVAFGDNDTYPKEGRIWCNFGFDAEWASRGWPQGILIQQRPGPRDPEPGPKVLIQHAEEVLELPALSSIGRRDRAKYGFTEESVLYGEYHGVLTRYRELIGDARPDLAARLDAQLAEYEPGPAAKP